MKPKKKSKKKPIDTTDVFRKLAKVLLRDYIHDSANLKVVVDILVEYFEDSLQVEKAKIQSILDKTYKEIMAEIVLM